MAAPGRYDITLIRGDDYSRALIFTQGDEPLAVPTTGWTAQVRTAVDGELVAAFTIDSTAGATGIITISLPASVTATFPDTSVWDIQCSTGGVKTYVSGKIKLFKDVTHD